MASIDDIRQERLKKVKLMRDHGMDPYPPDTKRTHENHIFLSRFDDFKNSGETVVLVGRILSLRDQGGIVFLDFFDGSAKVQALLRKDDISDEKLDLFLKVVDKGDFIEVQGTAFTTKRGMNSLLVSDWRMLAKSLRPVPEEWFGLKDEDERYRKRYLDMILSNEVRERITRRSRFWNTIRSFMLEHEFVEVETPVLETKTGGAEARPFITHHNALDIDTYLRISLELPQKKIMAGGIQKTFEIGRIFRNEGMSHEHAQDYTHFEFYAAYMDAREGLPFIENLYRRVARDVYGTETFTIGEHTVDLSKPWNQINYCDVIQEHYGFDPLSVTLDEAHAIAKKHGVVIDASADIGRVVDLLWKKIRKTITGPVYLVNQPAYLEPLAKRRFDDPRIVHRFQIILAGSEMGKAFNELNDPIDQAERFKEQQALRDAGDDEAQMADWEYVEAMEYGMPPMFGFGVSERLFSFLENVSIREAQIFPLMRPRTDTSFTKEGGL